jgi:hypothetical protein
MHILNGSELGQLHILTRLQLCLKHTLPVLLTALMKMANFGCCDKKKEK